jgi:hypothetical protein
MGLWEHSGRDLHSNVPDLGFYAVSYSAMLETAGQDYVYVSEGRMHQKAITMHYP